MEEQPLLSVITACFNRASFIARAVESVQAQDYPFVEHLIIDGGSTDGSLQVFGRYPHLRVLSEPDRGVYDAFNKGIRLARGAVIGLLNSDDYYEPNVLGAVMARFHDDASLMSVSGGARIVEVTPDGVERILLEFARAEECTLTLHNILFGFPIINARFFRRQVYSQIGVFDAGHRVASDMDFLVRVALERLSDTTLGRVVYVYEQHGGSLTLNGDPIPREARLERLQILEGFLRGAVRVARDHRLIARSHVRELRALLDDAARRHRVGDFARYLLRATPYLHHWLAAFLSSFRTADVHARLGLPRAINSSNSSRA